MAEYIEREALYEKAYWHGEHPDVGNPFPDGVDAIDIDDVYAIPAADVAPVRHGRWERTEDGAALCTACKRKMNPSQYGYAFCSLCGAKMDGGTN